MPAPPPSRIITPSLCSASSLAWRASEPPTRCSGCSTSPHNKMRPAFLPVLLVTLVAGCASMDRTQCTSANWYAIGLEDGARGQPLERLGAHRRACAEHAVAPDAERYVAGRNDGLKSFCTS